MLPEFRDPVPEPIERFSPTLANELLACPRRVGFARDPSFAGWKRPSTFSVLGDAAHAVAELVAKRHNWPIEPEERRRRLEIVWDDRVRAGAAKLSAAWAPAEPPPIEEWPTYHVTRSRTIRRAERAIAERGVEAHGASGMNVSVPVPDETGVVARLLHAGWAVAPGARFRMGAPPGIRITVSTLGAAEAGPLADAVAAALGPAPARSYV